MKMLLMGLVIVIVVLAIALFFAALKVRSQGRMIKESEDPLLLLPKEERVARVREQLEREQEAYEQELLERNMNIIRRHGADE